jgi:hypothetical protein
LAEDFTAAEAAAFMEEAAVGTAVVAADVRAGVH